MVYLEYERVKMSCISTKNRFAHLLLEKERILTETLPNAIRYDKDNVQTSIEGNLLDNYVIEMDEKGIDKRLAKLRQSLKDWEILLEFMERRLRSSKEIPDRIYVMRHLDGYGIKRICKEINYSRSQIYRILDKIEKNCRNL